MRNKRFLLLLLGVHCLMTAGAQRVIFRASSQLSESLPSSVDNSIRPFFPPVIDQMGGSCAQAAGIGYMLTYEINRLLNRDASASAENRLSYQFAWNMLNEGEDQGGFVDQGLMLAQQYGIMTEADYGKHFLFKWASGYDKYLRAMHFRVEKIYVYEDSIPLMKRYLYDKGNGSSSGGILTFSGQATGWTITDDYSGPSLTGYHALLTSLATDGSHAMTIVGYDDTVNYTDAEGRQHEGAFIVVNSWGNYWKDRGRFYLPYDFFRNKAVPMQKLSDTVEGISVTTYNPLVVLKLKVDYSSRDDLRFSVATSNDRKAAAPRSHHVISAFSNQGGDLPMAGPYLGSQLEFALDMTPQVKADDKQWFLNIYRSFRGKEKGKGQLMALSAIDYRGTQPREYLWRSKQPADITDGYNYYSIPLAPLFTVPVSSLHYTGADGNLSSDTYLIRTADGQHAKVRFSTPDTQNQTITIRYQVKQ